MRGEFSPDKILITLLTRFSSGMVGITKEIPSGKNKIKELELSP